MYLTPPTLGPASLREKGRNFESQPPSQAGPPGAVLAGLAPEILNAPAENIKPGFTKPDMMYFISSCEAGKAAVVHCKIQQEKMLWLLFLLTKFRRSLKNFTLVPSGPNNPQAPLGTLGDSLAAT